MDHTTSCVNGLQSNVELYTLYGAEYVMWSLTGQCCCDAFLVQFPSQEKGITTPGGERGHHRGDQHLIFIILTMLSNL